MKQPTHRPEAPRGCGEHQLQTAVDVQGMSMRSSKETRSSGQGRRGREERLTRPQPLTLPTAASPQPWHRFQQGMSCLARRGQEGTQGGSAATALQARAQQSTRSSPVLLSFMKSREFPPLPKVVSIDLNFSLVQHNLSNERSTGDSAVPFTTGSVRQQLPQAFLILFH